MAELIQKTKEAALAYKLAIFWFFLFSVNSLCTCIVASMAGSVWHNLGTQEKFTVIVAILGNWTGTIMAFISKTAQKIEKGELPIEEPAPEPPKTV